MTTQLMAFLSAKRNRLKVYQNNNVYLKSGTEFEIELYNPHQNNILAMIYINDNLISSSGLVIKPGQRIYLDRYMDTPNKFKFSTYEVDDNKLSNQAIKNNGKVKIVFYAEKRSYFTISAPIIYNNFNNYDWKLDGTCTYPVPQLTTTEGITFISSDTTSYYCNTGNCNLSDISGYSTSATISTNQPTKETGRIEKGGSSNQKFESINMEFENYPISTVEYQILPESQKNMTLQDIKMYCPQCRYRIRKETWTYCPKCGEKL